MKVADDIHRPYEKPIDGGEHGKQNYWMKYPFSVWYSSAKHFRH
jgi:hypothetical protein